MIGAHDFVTKPFSKERMGVTLHNAVALQMARQQVAQVMQLSSDKGNGHQTIFNPDNDKVEDSTIISLVSAMGDIRKIDEVEKAVIRFAVRLYNGRMSLVARKLGIGRSTLYRKLDMFGKI
jgi:DNA-binding NtrC family response regulator